FAAFAGVIAFEAGFVELCCVWNMYAGQFTNEAVDAVATLQQTAATTASGTTTAASRRERRRVLRKVVWVRTDTLPPLERQLTSAPIVTRGPRAARTGPV